MKDIIAMSNIRDGGTVVVGVPENKTTKTHELASLTDAQVKSFDTTDVIQFVNGDVQPGVRLEVVKETHQDKKVVILDVAEFDREPNICTRPGPNNSFYPGQLIIRTDAAQSRVIQTAEEMRQVLLLALSKTSEGLLRDIGRILEGRSASDVPAPDQFGALLEDWAREREAFASCMSTTHKKDVWTFSSSL